MTTEEGELSYNDYTHDFMGKVGNIQDFSRDFLMGLARVFEDTLNFVSLRSRNHLRREGRGQHRHGRCRRDVTRRNASGDADGPLHRTPRVGLEKRPVPSHSV